MDPITQEIFDLIKVKLREQGAYDHNAYSELVEETIEYYRERGLLSDDDNDELIRNQLLEQWEWLQEHMSEEE